MNYEKIYNNLIARSKDRQKPDYCEKHHIIPRCMGGTDDESNLALLTPEEHYVAHQLLVKIYPNNPSLVYAANMMIPNRESNKYYGWLKRKFAKTLSERQSGERNSQFGSFWVTDGKLRKKLKYGEYIPDGYVLGRGLDKQKVCLYCENEFVSSYKSLTKFCSDTCKTEYRSPAHKIIHDNIDAMVLAFQSNGSIDKTLKSFGIVGERSGNRYFSKILSERGIEILRRRNSAPKA